MQPVPPPPPGRRSHPAGTAGLVLSCCALVPFTVVGGLVGSLLGAVGVRAARREPQRWSDGTARAAIAVGLVLGSVPGLVLAMVKADDWTWVPFGLLLVHAAVVFGLAFGVRAAVPGSMGVLSGAGLAVGLALAVVAFLVLMGELLWDAVFGGDP